jgi:hypothetical protein
MTVNEAKVKTIEIMSSIESDFKIYLASIHKWLICPISVSGENFNPQNTSCIPAVKFFAFLELEQISSFMDGHYL